MHEKQMHDASCFVTLTYAPEKLPPGGMLCLDHFQKFMKKLRSKRVLLKWKDVMRLSDAVRYFHCGEYGEATGRPHYHALLFGVDFRDRKPWKKGAAGDQLFVSDALSFLWPHGFATLADVTFESAAYVARYCVSDDQDGSYRTMSRRPGIGAAWYERFKEDVYPSDFVVMRGRRMRPPKFYDGKLGAEYLEALKVERVRAAREHAEDQVPERLAVREEVQKAKDKFYRREL